MPDRRARPREHDTSHADTAGGTLERHPELPGNTVSCELPGPFALVSGDAMDGGDATARQSTAGKRRLWPVPWGSWADNTARELQQPHDRPGEQDLRSAAGRDLGIHRARSRYYARRRAAAPGRMARTRLVSDRRDPDETAVTRHRRRTGPARTFAFGPWRA